MLAWSFAVGIVTSLVAAVLPARSAARVDPVHALQKGSYQSLSAGREPQRVAAVALGLFGGSVAVCSRPVLARAVLRGLLRCMIVGAAARAGA